ncbi:TonB-dependent receptor [Roseimarinus sediminis]|uniref:TonB-dependent receptor n=1 Tax=Roseimarinus sediminis TaxID=1610899 RepID=UPI003D25B531
MRHAIYLFFLLFLTIQLEAQKTVSLSGRIKDAANGEDLIGATVYVDQLKTGTASNSYGYFSLGVQPGFYKLSVSFLGYETAIYTISADRDTLLDIRLEPSSEQLGEIVVSTEAVNQNIIGNEMGTFTLTPKSIKAIPVLFGEQDVLKTIQLMPGVSSAGEGSSGFFVRGGQADQNLVLLDDAPVFNPSHLLGFFSVFNSDAINSVKLYKGGVPARFGGRASSVLDVHMREGNTERLSLSGGIGLISSRATLEGPIGKKGSSFLLSGRRTYADLFLLLSKNETLRESRLYFYDLNLKTHLELNSKNQLYLSGYLGRDALKTSIFGFDWGNKVATLRWNHLFSSRFFSNTSIIFNDYNYDTAADLDFAFDLSAGIRGNTFKQRFTWFAGANNTVTFGAEVNDYLFKPGSLEVISLENEAQNFEVSSKEGLESAAYLFNEQKIGSRLTLGYGLRLSHFIRRGPSTEYQFDHLGDPVDTISYQKGDWYAPYLNYEPRFNATFVFNENTSVKAGFNRLTQYIHLLQNATAGTPIDYWIPSSANVKPQIADQISAGIFRNFSMHRYQLSAEVYYKNMQNQIDYRTGAELVLNEMVESELLYGKGKSYGLELLLEKKEGAFTGWIAYTLARSLRQIDGINKGVWYPARQDRVHDVSVVGVYQLNPKWTFSATWVYYTGNAVTFPAGKYYFEGNVASLYTERNGYRMPDYHRLDVAATWLLKERKNHRSELSFSVYNAYARKNPYSYVFSEDPDHPGQTQTTMVYLFSAIPSISWNFKF